MSKQKIFGCLSDGREVTEFTLANNDGIVAKILNYGGTIRSLYTPNKNGDLGDIVLGFDRLAGYDGEHPYFGAIVGRVAGRIAGGRLQIGKVANQLTINDPPNHLHGGANGFDSKIWDANFSEHSGLLTLSYVSPDGEEGYPGELCAQVTYQLTDDSELIVNYRARTTAETIVNLTQHSYFNLSGDHSRTVVDHDLQVNADKTLELDGALVPTGRILSVSEADLDFRTPRKVCDLDNYWILAETSSIEKLMLAVQLRHEDSGRILNVWTTAPGVQVYSGGSLPTDLVGKSGVPCGPNKGICLETQVHPNSPNHKGFPSIVLAPGSEYKSTTVFQFTTDK